MADLKKLQDQREKDLVAKAQELKDLQAKINDGRLSLAQDKLADLSKQYEEKEIALKRAQDDATRELNKKRDDMLAQIDERVMPVINQVVALLGELAGGVVLRAAQEDVLLLGLLGEVGELVLGEREPAVGDLGRQVLELLALAPRSFSRWSWSFLNPPSPSCPPPHESRIFSVSMTAIRGEPSGRPERGPRLRDGGSRGHEREPRSPAAAARDRAWLENA